MELRNPKYNAYGTLDCEINHPVYGWVPHTISSDENPKLHDTAAKASPKPYVAPKPNPADIAGEARAQRAALLQQSDWTQVADAPVEQAAWATYRQGLRDITAQPGFPADIDWPTRPE